MSIFGFGRNAAPASTMASMPPWDSALQLPLLETARLRLRKLTVNDAPDVFLYNSDPEVVRYLLWTEHLSLAESQADIERVIKGYDKGSDLRWGIELKSTGRVIGGCKLTCVLEHKRAEAGYVLAREHWGQGYATETVRAILRYGFNDLGLNRIEALTFVEHAASGRVLEKCGFQLEATLRGYELIKGEFRDLKMYSVLKGEGKAPGLPE
jgi:ribosomal-protein-alanine N-acetyltransferase